MSLFLFIIKDGFAGLVRSKFTSFLTMITLSLAVLLLLFYFLISQNILLKISELKSRVTIEIFLDPDLDSSDIENFNRRLQKITGVDSVRFVSKEAALEKFKELFSGDYVQLIDENPLPASFQVKLTAEMNQAYVQKIIAEIKSLGAVDEVVYHRKLLSALNQYYDSLRRIFVGVGLGLALLSFFLLWINIKLTLKIKERAIETMKLVGAKPGLILGPFYVQAAIEGATAGLISLLAVRLIFRFFRFDELFPAGVNFSTLNWAVGVSLLFSIFTCYWATRRLV